MTTARPFERQWHRSLQRSQLHARAGASFTRETPDKLRKFGMRSPPADRSHASRQTISSFKDRCPALAARRRSASSAMVPCRRITSAARLEVGSSTALPSSAGLMCPPAGPPLARPAALTRSHSKSICCAQAVLLASGRRRSDSASAAAAAEPAAASAAADARAGSLHCGGAQSVSAQPKKSCSGGASKASSWDEMSAMHVGVRLRLARRLCWRACVCWRAGAGWRWRVISYRLLA